MHEIQNKSILKHLLHNQSSAGPHMSQQAAAGDSTNIKESVCNAGGEKMCARVKETAHVVQPVPTNQKPPVEEFLLSPDVFTL